jgi:hypothetical protein
VTYQNPGRLGGNGNVTASEFEVDSFNFCAASMNPATGFELPLEYEYPAEDEGVALRGASTASSDNALLTIQLWERHDERH